MAYLTLNLSSHGSFHVFSSNQHVADVLFSRKGVELAWIEDVDLVVDYETNEATRKVTYYARERFYSFADLEDYIEAQNVEHESFETACLMDEIAETIRMHLAA